MNPDSATCQTNTTKNFINLGGILRLHLLSLQNIQLQQTFIFSKKSFNCQTYNGCDRIKLSYSDYAVKQQIIKQTE